MAIRQLKNNNDKINKSIGVLNHATLWKESQTERHMVDRLL